MSNEKKMKRPVTRGVARVPMVQQMEAVECGAACLAMVLGYYGKWVPIEQARIDCGISRDGSSARNILLAARGYGLTANGFKCDADTLAAEGSFPCIIHWNNNHFVVLEGFAKGNAHITDPSKGKYTVTEESFRKAFSGVCLMMEPGPGFVRDGERRTIPRFALKRIRGTGIGIVFLAVTTILATLIGIIKPAFSRVFTDRILTGVNPGWLIPFTVGLLVLVWAEAAVNYAHINVGYHLDGKVVAYSDTSYMWRLLRLPMSFFNQRGAASIQRRKTSNSVTTNTVVNTLIPLLFEEVSIAFYFIIMIRYSPLLTAVGLSTMCINLYVAWLITKKRNNLAYTLNGATGGVKNLTMTGIDMIETIKASGSENEFFTKWAGKQAEASALTIKKLQMGQYLGLIPQILSTLSNLAVLGIGIYLTMQGEFTVGMVLAFQGYLTAFMAPTNRLILAGQTILELNASMNGLEDVMQYPLDTNYEEEKLGEAEEYSKFTGTIELKNVTFGYSKYGKPLLENFNLTIQPRERIAIVGSSGCGKSTLSKLISGLYKPWSGEILFDGVPLDRINRNVFTGSVSVVDQDVILFEDTIENNIKMWDSSIEDFEMILAARDAQLHDDIMQRDGGYQYRLTEGGKDFSGGQQQRLEIARVLAQDPTVLILDEATSALDAKTEHEVVKAIRARGITTIVIAHRLSTIRDCDRIIVLDQGKIVESGTHQELMARQGLYASLVSNE